MTAEKKLELIEAYQRGTLSDLEKTQFESLLANDPDFAAELEDYKLIFEGFDKLHFDVFEKNILNFEEKYKNEAAAPIPKGAQVQETAKKTFKIRKYLAVAALISGLLLTAFVLQLYVGNSTPDVYTALYETPDAITASVRGEASGNSQDIKDEALKQYNSKNFAHAAELLTKVVAADEKDYEAAFYLGICQMEKSDFKAAKKLFETITAADKGYFGQAAQWYGLLCDHKSGNLTSAAQTAKTITADSNHNFYDKAKEYLKLTD